MDVLDILWYAGTVVFPFWFVWKSFDFALHLAGKVGGVIRKPQEKSIEKTKPIIEDKHGISPYTPSST